MDMTEKLTEIQTNVNDIEASCQFLIEELDELLRMSVFAELDELKDRITEVKNALNCAVDDCDCADRMIDDLMIREERKDEADPDREYEAWDDRRRESD